MYLGLCCEYDEYERLHKKPKNILHKGEHVVLQRDVWPHVDLMRRASTPSLQSSFGARSPVSSAQCDCQVRWCLIIPHWRLLQATSLDNWLPLPPIHQWHLWPCQRWIGWIQKIWHWRCREQLVTSQVAVNFHTFPVVCGRELIPSVRCRSAAGMWMSTTIQPCPRA